MTVSLKKGQNVSLTKEAPGLSRLVVGLGWNQRQGSGHEMDLDVSAFVVGADDKVIDPNRAIVFYNNKSFAGCDLSGDNQTGVGEGDDETITVDLPDVPSEASAIHIAISIYEAAERGQNFGMVTSYARIINSSDGAELARIDLQEDACLDTAIIVGSIYRDPSGSGWKVRALAEPHPDLGSIARKYGVNL